MFFQLISSPDIYGYIAAFLTTIAFLPQLIKTLKTKSAEDVSIIMLVLFLTGLLSWIIYGWYVNSIPIVIANVITFSLNALILTFKILFGMEIKNKNDNL